MKKHVLILFALLLTKSIYGQISFKIEEDVSFPDLKVKIDSNISFPDFKVEIGEQCFF
ncbi:hypothetical protein FHR24_002672 [Wenyingzhuangia heitensis]|uniref:Uncharacterized protein n=1 Tax=Wenyingzhuangia heitensis TaxID=1487859 RepID=A0ABX0UCX2_9FLAO|nr:hypothetical protein [Wenyingzhuangia heitensis]